ncbi:hypothetical protein DH2020_023170 [Rehmannia glutinosa]|uniref:Uncharacterized protein n=1 Tax=Rehmannia glutinosa TaxID=99300 RepID=A0ABR0W645_REHGL
MEDLGIETPETHDCVVKLRLNPQRRKEKVVIGCGAGFGGDRPIAALKLLRRVKELDYLVLECLAERTLAERYIAMKSGGKGYDSRSMFSSQLHDVSVYLGAAPIVECLEKYRPDVIITSRVADASLFLGPMVFELGWNWDELQLLAQGYLAGHLLECGCQLTGGYYMHPGDKHRNMSFQNLLDLSLPFAEVTFNGTVCVAKAEGTGGVLNFSTCAEQLLYEVGDPGAYITPDVDNKESQMIQKLNPLFYKQIVDFQDVTFQPLSDSKVLCFGAKPSPEPIPQNLLLLRSKECGWKGWGEISYGGYGCTQRAKAAEFLVRAWMEESYPGISKNILSYIIGLDSLKTMCIGNILSKPYKDIRLRMDGLFEKEEHAIHFTKEFTALYTNGPAGGGGISSGWKKEIFLEKGLVGREYVHWQVSVARNNIISSTNQNTSHVATNQNSARHESNSPSVPRETIHNSSKESITTENQLSAAPAGQEICLYDVAHSRAGDKGNDLNFSIIPHYPPDIQRLKKIITPEWVKEVLSPF